MLVEKYRQEFRVAENLNHYSEEHYKIAERKFLKFALGMGDWVFQTGCVAPGSTRNDWGTLRPCIFPPMAAKSKPPAVRVVVNSKDHTD